MGPSNRRDDGEAEPGTSTTGVASRIEPSEATQDEISILGGNTVTVVIDMDPGVAVGVGDLDPH